MFTREEVERAIQTEENGWLAVCPHNITVFNVLDNVRMHLGLPRPLMNKTSSLRQVLSFNGKAKE